MYSVPENFKKKKKHLFFALVLNAVFLLYFMNSHPYHTERYGYGESQPLVPITKDVKIKQEFISGSDRMTGFEIQFATYGRQNISKVFVKLTDTETNTVIFEESADAQNLADNQYRKFDFKEISDSKARKYILSIESDAAPENAITVWSGNGQCENTALLMGASPVFKTLNFNVYYAGIEKFAIFLYALAGILSLLAILLIGNSTIRNFVILSGIFGSCFCIVTPFYHPLDEISHFYRAYDVSEGDPFLKSDNGLVGGWLPEDINKIQYERRADETFSRKIPINDENRVFISNYIKHTSQYCFVSYIPAATGIFIGKIFTRNMNLIAYLARVTSLVFYIFLTAVSIKTIPKGKNLLMAVALIPFQLLLSASVSLDGILVASVFLFIAICFKLHDSDRPVEHRDIIVLILMLILITGTKSIAYTPVFLLFFIIQPSKFKSRKAYFFSLVAGILSLFLLMLAMKIFSPVLATTDERAAGANARNQILFIFHDPLIFFYAVVNTFHLQMNAAFSDLQHIHFFGKNIGNICTFILPVFLFWLAKTDCSPGGQNDSEINSGLIAFIIISNIFLINLGMYLFFSPVGSITVNGIQGRYYIPLAALLLITVNKNSVSLCDRRLNFKSAYVLTLILNYNSLLLIKSMY